MITSTKEKPTDRKEYYKKYHKGYIRKKMGLPEPKIRNINDVVVNTKKEDIYPVNFPKKEFDKKLDEILEDGIPIKEKTLKDIIMWDILDKKGILTPERMLRIYYGFNWENAIEKFMQAREYFAELVEGNIIYNLRTE